MRLFQGQKVVVKMSVELHTRHRGGGIGSAYSLCYLLCAVCSGS